MRTTSPSWPDGLFENFVSKKHPFEIVREIGEIGGELRSPLLLSWQEISKDDFHTALRNNIEEWT